MQDLNPRTSAYKAVDLPTELIRLIWWGVMDLNHRARATSDLQSGALTRLGKLPVFYFSRQDSIPASDSLYPTGRAAILGTTERLSSATGKIFIVTLLQ